MSDEQLKNMYDRTNKLLNGESKDTYGFAPAEIQELIKEVERLKKREQECINHYLVQCKYASEMEDKYITANYIINELEKDLKGKIDEDRLNILSNSHWKYILDKLQELKGSDKE